MTAERRSSESISTLSRYPPWPLPQRVYAVVLKRLARWLGIKAYYVYRRPLGREQEIPGPLDRDYRGKFRSEQELMPFADDPMLRLPRDFIRDAVQHGDLCYGILFREQLVAYRWYSLSRPVPCEPGVFIRYEYPGRVYTYKTFTHPAHRGKRVHLHTARDSDAYFSSLGYDHTVGYIETHNFASVRNNARLRDRRVIGFVVLLRMLGRRIVFNSPGTARNHVSMATRSV